MNTDDNDNNDNFHQIFFETSPLQAIILTERASARACIHARACACMSVCVCVCVCLSVYVRACKRTCADVCFDCALILCFIRAMCSNLGKWSHKTCTIINKVLLCYLTVTQEMYPQRRSKKITPTILINNTNNPNK